MDIHQTVRGGERPIATVALQISEVSAAPPDLACIGIEREQALDQLALLVLLTLRALPVSRLLGVLGMEDHADGEERVVDERQIAVGISDVDIALLPRGIEPPRHTRGV